MNAPLALRIFIMLIFGIEIASVPVAVSEFREIAFNEDWANFWAAGATVGTRALLDPHAHMAWQAAHHLRPQIFVYLPGWAWFLAPFARIPPMPSLLLNDLVMLLSVLVSARIAGKIYGLNMRMALIIVGAWYPVFCSIEVGQSAALALLFRLVAILGFVERRPVLCGVGAAAMLYKPTLAIAFLLLLLVRREWRALAVSGMCACAWYVASVAATAGDWAWPVHYAASVSGYFHADYAMNAHKSQTLPTLLMAAGVPTIPAIACGIVVLIGGAWLFAKRPPLEAASLAGAIGLLASPHAWQQDLAMLVPAICYVATRSSKHVRNVILAPAYAIAATWWLLVWGLPFNPLALIVVGAVVLWAGFALKQSRGLRSATLVDASV